MTQAIANAVWDEAIVGHSGAGSTAQTLSAAGSAGDPWVTALPGGYTGTQAGKMLADILTDTAEIGIAGSGLTAINLPNQTMDIIGNITGNLSGSVGSVSGISFPTNFGIMSISSGGYANVNLVEVLGDEVIATSGAPDVNVVSIDTDVISAAAVSAAAVTKMQTGLATSGQVVTLANNTIVEIAIPTEIEIPNTTDTLIFRIALKDSAGNMVAPDSTPTITLAIASGTTRASRLAAATNPSTGVYEWLYTGTSTDPEERLYGEITVTEGGVPRKTPFTIQVFNQTAYRFTTDDRDALTGLQTSLSIVEGLIGTPVLGTVSDDIAGLVSDLDTRANSIDAVISEIDVSIDSVVATLGTPSTTLAEEIADIAIDASTTASGISTIQSSVDDVSAYSAVTRAFLINKHTAAVESPVGTFTWNVRNDLDSANAYTVVYVKSTGQRTVTIL